MKNYEKIEKLLSEIDIEVVLKDEEIEDFDELREFLEDNNYFDVEIIYYSNAMKYLSEHDSSLSESMALAQDMGYEPKDINSELLASLLASQNVREDFEGLESEISDLLE